MRDSTLPTVDEWNEAIKAEGFDLVIDLFDLREDDGYLPATLKGEESGFEWYLKHVADMQEYPDMDPPFVFKPWIGDRDVALTYYLYRKRMKTRRPTLPRQFLRN